LHGIPAKDPLVIFKGSFVFLIKFLTLSVKLSIFVRTFCAISLKFQEKQRFPLNLNEEKRMKINISGLSEGVLVYDFAKPAIELGLEQNFLGEVHAHVTLEKSIHQITAMVNASVKGVFICDRCADEFEEEVKTSFTSIYTWNEDGEERNDDDFHILKKEDNSIDLDGSVKEYLLISIPLKLLCKKNCEIPESLKVEPEVEHVVDPRWKKLQDLLRTEKN
jgi:uncharacterized metal-binding protein YceD (DUF177 family)